MSAVPTKPRYIQVMDSLYRTWETNENGANFYGRVLAYNEASDNYIPVICGHGGSMWLCAGCAEQIMQAERETSNQDDAPAKERP